MEITLTGPTLANMLSPVTLWFDAVTFNLKFLDVHCFEQKDSQKQIFKPTFQRTPAVESPLLVLLS